MKKFLEVMRRYQRDLDDISLRNPQLFKKNRLDFLLATEEELAQRIRRAKSDTFLDGLIPQVVGLDPQAYLTFSSEARHAPIPDAKALEDLNILDNFLMDTWIAIETDLEEEQPRAPKKCGT